MSEVVVRSVRELRELATATAVKGGHIDYETMTIHIPNEPMQVVRSEIPIIPFRLLYCGPGGLGQEYADATPAIKKKMLFDQGLSENDVLRILDK